MAERYHCNRCNRLKPETDFSEMARAQARADDPDAMCLDCVDALFRSRMSMTEAVAFIREENDRKVAHCRLPGQEERTRADLRRGRALHHSDFIAALRTLIPSLVVGEGNIPGHLSLYDTDPSGRARYLCWIHEGTAPEYSIVHVDACNLPVREQRGWRTVLLQLLRRGVITEEQANRRFGHPNGEAAKFYLAQLYELRNPNYA